MKQERDEQKRKKPNDQAERQGNTSGQKPNRRTQGGPTAQQDNRDPNPRPTDFDEAEEDRTDQRRRA
jgi:hypothetical protein